MINLKSLQQGKISIHVEAKEKKERENINGFIISVFLLEYNFHGKEILSNISKGWQKHHSKEKKNLTIRECSDDLHNFLGARCNLSIIMSVEGINPKINVKF